MFFYVVSRTYAEIFSLLRICSGLLSNSPGLYDYFKLKKTLWLRCDLQINSALYGLMFATP